MAAWRIRAGERLGDQIESLLHHVLLNHLAVIVAGHEQNVDIGRQRAQPVNQHRPAHSGHNNVRQNQIRWLRHPFKDANCILGAVCGHHIMSAVGQERLQQTQNILLVIHHKEAHIHETLNLSCAKRHNKQKM